MNNEAPESEPHHFRREAARLNIYLAATLVGDRGSTPVNIRNLSSTGALVQSRTNLDEEADITLARGSLRAKGSLVWREGRLGGIKFSDPINLGLWIPGAAHKGQMQIDRMVGETRGQAAPVASTPEPAMPTAKTETLTGRIVEELAFVSRKLETLGSELCDDPLVVARHATKIQDIDIATQVLGHLARLLDSPDPAALLRTIGMDDLRRRLERTVLP